MKEHELMALAAGPMLAVVRDLSAKRLDAPTPCADYDVGRLINHLLFWGPSLQAAARKEAVAPPAADEQDVNLTEGEWKDQLEAQTNLIVAAWSEPAAWKGHTGMGAPMEMPAPMIGGMVLGEIVVHGWDIARAIGQQPTWDEEVLSRVHQEVEKTAEQGREMGIYAERVPVPDTASVLDRLLGLTGRDPNWRR